MVIDKEMGHTNTPMVIFILVNSKPIKKMELEDYFMLIKANTMDNGLLVKSKVKACIYIPIKMYFQVIGIIIKNMEMVPMCSMLLE